MQHNIRLRQNHAPRISESGGIIYGRTPSCGNQHCRIVEGKLASVALASGNVRIAHGHPRCDHPGHGIDCELSDRAHLEGTPLREVWLGMGILQRLCVFVLFLGTFAMEYRALAASAFATQEIRSGRSIGILQAFRCGSTQTAAAFLDDDADQHLYRAWD
jgi:hypothetical protein